MNLVLGLLGCWLIIDGIGSIIIYKKQSLIEHIPRLVRAGCGIVITCGAIL